LTPHGVLWHGYKGDFGMTEEQSLYIKKKSVFVRRLNPMLFIKDPSVNMSNLDEAKWVGRIIDIPLMDLLEDETLDVDKKMIKGFPGYGQKVGLRNFKDRMAELQAQGADYRTIMSSYKSLVDVTDENFKKSKAVQFVRLYELFVRSTKSEKGKGNIILLCNDQDKPLRDNEWKIKAEGWPAKVLCFNDLPDAQFGMADIDAYASIADQKNIITNLQIRNAQQMTKTWVGIAKSGASEEDIRRVQEGTNSIVLFDGDTVNGKMSVASPGGGASNELYLLDQRIQRNLEDKSGITDLKRGFLQSGEESAASVKIRAAGGGARPAYRQDIMSDFLKESFGYINQLNKQFMPYKEAVRVVGTMDIEWSENPSEEALQADVDVEIDVISMLPESPERELQNLNNILQLSVLGLSNPVVARKLAEEGKKINLSPIIEQILMRSRINNADIFSNIKPEESQGFVSVQQVREARDNVFASMSSEQIPYPPRPTDDHVAKLETYMSAKTMLEAMGQVSDTLNRLIEIHQALLAQIQEKQTEPNKQVLKQPSVATM
jgi:hypothetical protein